MITNKRYIKFDVKFDLKVWASYAESAHVDGRCVNFMLAYGHELMKENKQHRHSVNARNYMMFANAISGIDDWETPENLAFILQIASGAFLDDKDNVVGNLFTTFVANKLDKLPTPEDMLMKPWDKIYPEIKKCVYGKDGKYRADIASILGTRLLNYSRVYCNTPKAKSSVVENRILDFCKDADKEGKLFNWDLLFDITKNLMTEFPKRFTKFILDPKIRKVLI